MKRIAPSKRKVSNLNANREKLRGWGTSEGEREDSPAHRSADGHVRTAQGNRAGSAVRDNRGPPGVGENLSNHLGKRRPQEDRPQVSVPKSRLHPDVHVQGKDDRKASSQVRVGRPTVEYMKSLGAACDKCPFYNRERFQPVLPVVPQNPYGVLIGESPGREECEQGQPFVGATGEALNDELMNAGLLRSKLVVINAIACLPTVKNVATMNRAFHACRKVFLHFMRPVDRKLPVFAMGGWAVGAFTGKRVGIDKTRGFIRPDVELHDTEEVVTAIEGEDEDETT